MKILGLVWAASIVNQPLPMVSAMPTDDHDHQFQHQELLPEVDAALLESLTHLYHWVLEDIEPVAAFRGYGANLSSLASGLKNMTLEFEGSDEEAQFSPLSPAISTGLTSIEPPVTQSLVSSEAGSLAVNDQWHGWNAVAAVRIVEAGPIAVSETMASEAISHADASCIADPQVDFKASPIAIAASPKVQIWVHDHFVGEVAGQVAAQPIADKLRSLIKDNRLDPNHLQPVVGSNFVGVRHGDDILFIVDETMRSHPEVPALVIATQWINNLRMTFDAVPLEPVHVHMAVEGLRTTSQELYGTASWYGPGFHGRITANGERFNENALTAAHKTLPFNTRLKVTNRLNGQSVIVRINDRGPYIGDRSLDLSKAAARCLGSVGKGVVPYEATTLESIPKSQLDTLKTALLPSDF